MASNPWNRDIKVEGRIGTWYIIDTLMVDSCTYALVESCDFGDEAGSLVIRLPHFLNCETRKLKNGKTVLWIPEANEVCETWDDLKTALEENDIINNN